MQSAGQTNWSQLSVPWLMTLPILLLFALMSWCLLQPPKLGWTMQSVILMGSCWSPIFLTNTLSFLVFVCVFRCMCLFVACIPKYICCFEPVCLCECFVKHIGGICQVVDPVKGEFPLFTLRPSWFAINKNKGIIIEIMFSVPCFSPVYKFKILFQLHLSQLINNWIHISQD